MAMIDIDTIRFQNFFELVDEGSSGSLYSQDIINFRDIVGVGFDRVNAGM